MTLTAAQPELLLREARRMSLVAEEIRTTARSLPAGLAGGAWSGAAADAARGRVEELGRGGEAVADRLAEAADAVADTARRAAERLARRAELDRWVRSAADEVEAADRGRRATGEQGDLDAAWAADARRLADLLAALDPWELLPAWAAGVAALGEAGRQARGMARKAADYGRWARQARTAGGRSDEALAALRRIVAGRELPPERATAVRRVAARIALPLTVVSGVQDAVTGGGHGGARGVVTRVLGGGAAVSGGLLLAGVSAPAVVAVGGAALLAYAAWSTGTYVYDHRAQIGAFLRRAADGARSMARRGASSARRLVERLGAAVLPALPSPPLAVPW